MKIDYETKIEISVATDFSICTIDENFFYKMKIKIKDILQVIDFLDKVKSFKTSFYKKSFLISFCKSIICVNILNSNISWSDIINYRHLYNYYEKM